MTIKLLIFAKNAEKGRYVLASKLVQTPFVPRAGDEIRLFGDRDDCFFAIVGKATFHFEDHPVVAETDIEAEISYVQGDVTNILRSCGWTLH